MASLLTPKSNIYQFSTTPLYCWKNLDSNPWDSPLTSTNDPGTLISSSSVSMSIELPASANQQLYMKYGALVECGNGRVIVGAPGWNQTGQSNEGLFEVFNITGNFLTTISNPAGATGGFKFAQTGAIGCDRIVLGPVYTSSTYKLPMYDLEGTFLQYLEAPDGMSGDLSSGAGMWIQEDRVFYSGGTGIMIWDIHGNFLDYIADTSDRVSAGEGLIHAGYNDDMYDMGGQLVNGAVLPDAAGTSATGGVCITSHSLHACRGSLPINGSTYQEVEDSDLESTLGSNIHFMPYADGLQNNKGRLVAASENYQYVARSVMFGSDYDDYNDYGGVVLHSFHGDNLITYGTKWMFPSWQYDQPNPPYNNFGTALSMDLAYVWGGASFVDSSSGNTNYTNDYGIAAFKAVGTSTAFTPQQSMWANLS